MAELSLLEKIASKISQGKTTQQIATDADLDYSFVEGIIASEEFDEVFKALDPKSYAIWVENQADLKAKRKVMAMAREDSVHFYRTAKDLVLNSKELKDKEKLDAIFNLLKIAKVGEGEVAQEMVVLSQDNLKTILEAWGETNQ